MKMKKEIYEVYKKLSKGKYSYLPELVPIKEVILGVVKLGYKEDEVKDKIYRLWLEGEIHFERGDKKEGNFETPSGDKFYYLKIKKEPEDEEE